MLQTDILEISEKLDTRLVLLGHRNDDRSSFCPVTDSQWDPGMSVYRGSVDVAKGLACEGG